MNQAIREKILASSCKLELVQGDITLQMVDAIVNAANSHLAHGAGVAGAIVRSGGAQIQAESRDWVRQYGPVSHAEPAYTRAGKLSCKYVIHAVGPVWGEGGEDEKLRAAISGSLQLAAELGLSSIALPAISTGIFGFPKRRAAAILFEAIDRYFDSHKETGIQLVRVVLFDRTTLHVFRDVWDEGNRAEGTP